MTPKSIRPAARLRVGQQAERYASRATVPAVTMASRFIPALFPIYLAAAPIAFTLDEYEALDSVSNRTAFTLNSPAHQVPFAIIPSSPIELGECGTKNQFISLFLFLELSLVSPASPTTIGLIPPQFENRVNMRRICHILVGLLVCTGLLRTVSGFIFDYLHPEYVSSFPSYLYFLRAVPFLITAGAAETILFVIKRRNK